jgi:hypothetical protein
MGQRRRRLADDAAPARTRWRQAIRRNPVRAGALAAVSAAGLGFLVACGTAPGTASQAAPPISNAIPTATGPSGHSGGAPTIVGRSIAHGKPGQPAPAATRTRAGQPKATSSAAQPSVTAGSAIATPTATHAATANGGTGGSGPWLIDGRVICTAPASAVKSPARQPRLAMNIGLQSQNLSGRGSPKLRDTMNVDWVEQFSWNG